MTGRNSKNCFKVAKPDEKGQLTASFPVALSFKIHKDTAHPFNILSFPIPAHGPISIHNHPSISVINSALLPASSQSFGLIPICIAVWDSPDVLRMKTHRGPNVPNLKDMEAGKKPGGETGTSDCHQDLWLWGYFFRTKQLPNHQISMVLFFLRPGTLPWCTSTVNECGQLSTCLHVVYPNRPVTQCTDRQIKDDSHITHYWDQPLEKANFSTLKLNIVKFMAFRAASPLRIKAVYFYSEDAGAIWTSFSLSQCCLIKLTEC